MSLSLSVAESIAELDAAEWDSILGPRDLQSSHAFVRTCEESDIEDASYRHLVLREGGWVVAIASLCCMTVSMDLLAGGPIRRAVGLSRRLLPSLLRVPVVFCGLPVSFGRSCLRLAPGVEPSPVVRTVARAAEDLALETGAPIVCFKEYTGVEAVALEVLTELGYFRAPSLPGCALPVTWTTFDAYLGAMRSGYRRQVAANLRRRIDSSLRIRRLDDLTEACAPLHALYEQVMDRAPNQLERLGVPFFENLARHLSPESSALLVEVGGRPIAGAVLLREDNVLTFLLAGIDYERNEAHHAYLNLVIEVVAEGIRSRASRVELGQTSYALKTRLGGRLSPRWLFLHHRSAVGHRLLRSGAPWLFPTQPPIERRVFREARPVAERP